MWVSYKIEYFPKSGPDESPGARYASKDDETCLVGGSMKLRFVSRNPHKLAEAATILDPLGIEVVPLRETIEELQTIDASRLVRDKALRAFTKIGRKLFVEHTGLRLKTLNGLPGGLTQVFWDALKAERMSELFG